MAVIKYNFSRKTIDKLRNTKQGRDWPAVYILEDGKELYVGETVSISTRLRQHLDNPERKKLSRAHIITDENYNKSATLDTESLLIQYFAADNLFIIQNGNSGLSDHSYYDKEKYRAKFEIIWEDLIQAGLANKQLIQLRNTDLFKYSPYKALTTEQVSVVEAISESLIIGERITHIVHGEPGTGKSVLATYLVKYLKEHEATESLKIALVIPQQGLRKTIRRVFAKIKGLKSKMVIGPADVVGGDYDLLIVDEAHRLRRRVNLTDYQSFDNANKFYGLGKEGTQLDWIMKASKSQVLLYDQNQSVVPGDIRSTKLAAIKARHYTLTSQLRVMAGNDYIEYIDKILNLLNPAPQYFGEYELEYFDHVTDMVEIIKRQDREHGLSRLVAGYAWNWETRKDSSKDYDIELDGLKLKWNSTNIDWVNSDNAINEVGCIHTVQGYDLNYVGVIIGPELSYNPATRKLIVDKTKYMDINGKRTIQSDEELHEYIVNIYKTLLSRGIKGTYIHAVDSQLATYLKQFFRRLPIY